MWGMPFWLSVLVIILLVILIGILMYFWTRNYASRRRDRKLKKRGLDPEKENSKQLLKDIMPEIDKSYSIVISWMYFLTLDVIHNAKLLKGDHNKIHELINYVNDNLNLIINSFQYKEATSFNEYKKKLNYFFLFLSKNRPTVWNSRINSETFGNLNNEYLKVKNDSEFKKFENLIIKFETNK